MSFFLVEFQVQLVYHNLTQNQKNVIYHEKHLRAYLRKKWTKRFNYLLQVSKRGNWFLTCKVHCCWLFFEVLHNILDNRDRQITLPLWRDSFQSTILSLAFHKYWMTHLIDKNRSFILLISVLLLISHKTRVDNTLTKSSLFFYFSYTKFLWVAFYSSSLFYY